MTTHTAPPEPNYADGNWYAMTLGQFIGLLVDAGQDPAVLFRVTANGIPDGDGHFARTIVVTLLPNGYVKPAIGAHGCKRVHKTLDAMLKTGVVR